MKNVNELMLKYYDTFINDVNCHIQQYEDQKIDSYMFDRLAELSLEKYRGQIDVLYDLGHISYEDWSHKFDVSTNFVHDWSRKIRKMEYEPSDPEDN